MLWPRVYLYEEVDMYAIHDLEDIHNGKMLALLHSAVRFARSHILSCVLCSGKGFNCEVCRGKLISVSKNSLKPASYEAPVIDYYRIKNEHPSNFFYRCSSDLPI